MIDNILKKLDNSHIFLTGGAGTGKSYLTKEIISRYKKSSKHVVVLGSTGISAVAVGGQTIHSFFNFSIASSLEELVTFDKKSGKKKLKELKEILGKTDLIVIDEISMVSSNLMDMIRYRLESMSFNGKLLVVGDFFQLPPIIKPSQHSGLFDGRVYAFESDAWANYDFEQVELKEMKRTRDIEFFDILGKVRVGLIDDEILEYLLKLSDNRTIVEEYPTFLHGRNYEVAQINIKRLVELKQKEITIDAQVDLKKKNIHPKKLESWIKTLPVEQSLHLKTGAPVLFTYNKWGKFYNGERGIVEDIVDDYIIVSKKGKLIKVERQDFDLIEYRAGKNGDLEEKSLATFSQFPIKLAYAITIHKSQGMSIDSLICNVDHIFTPSQFYVAISRAIDPKKLYIQYNRSNFKNYLHKIIKIDNRVRNFYNNLDL